MSTLQIESLTVRSGRDVLISSLTTSVAAGECIALLGPNGAGKSSLLRAISGFFLDSAVHTEGRVRIDGAEPGMLAPSRRARLVAHAEDEIHSEFPFPVKEALELARVLSGTESAEFEAAVRDAELSQYLDRDLRTLSGGERQRVLIAMSWIQSPSLYLFDETVSQLDLNHLWHVGAAMRRRAREGGVISIVATHDWNFASRWADRLWVLEASSMVVDGKPSEVLTPELLARIYPGWSACVQADGRIDYPNFD